MKLTLPIDVVPNLNPPIFRWTQYVVTLAGARRVDHQLSVVPTMEVALLELIKLAKKQHEEVEAFKRDLKALNQAFEAQHAELRAAQEQIAALALGSESSEQKKQAQQQAQREKKR